jgi:hypothetical protein
LATCVAHAVDRRGRFQGQSGSENASFLIQTMSDRTDKVTLDFHVNFFFKIRRVEKQLMYNVVQRAAAHRTTRLHVLLPQHRN